MQVTKERTSGTIRPTAVIILYWRRQSKAFLSFKIKCPGLQIVEKDTAGVDSYLCPRGNTEPQLVWGQDCTHGFFYTGSCALGCHVTKCTTYGNWLDPSSLFV